MTSISSPAAPQPNGRLSRLQADPQERVTIWDAALGQYRNASTDAWHDHRVDTVRAVAGLRGIPCPAGGTAGLIRRVLTLLGRLSPSVSAHSTAQLALARGYRELATRCERKGDYISARMAQVCAEELERTVR